MRDFFDEHEVGDDITVFVNGEKIAGKITNKSIKVVKILNPRGVVIDIPETGEVELR